jgi:alanine racemase
MSNQFHGATLTINTGALAANWRALSRHAGPVETAAVIKADGSGLGPECVTRTLATAGCRTLFVAHLSEALRARAVAPDIDIYVLNGLPIGSVSTYLTHRLRPVLGSGAEIAEWRNQTPEGTPAALHVDTGMSRLGLRVEEVGDLPSVFRPHLVMSHFVASEESANPINTRQISAFERVSALFSSSVPSLSNSSGIFLRPHHSIREGLVRPGYALYGGNPTPGAPNPMADVVTLSATILQVRSVTVGETVGYNGAWVAKRPSMIAAVSLGYADGYLRSGSASNTTPGGIAMVAGADVPIVGRVSMDLITLDVTDVKSAASLRGEQATFIGPGLGVDRVASALGTNGYEILTSLGGRYNRVLV